MRTPKSAACRLAFAGWLGLAYLLSVAAESRAATPPENILPDTTLGVLKINNRPSRFAKRSPAPSSASSGMIRA